MGDVVKLEFIVVILSKTFHDVDSRIWSPVLHCIPGYAVSWGCGVLALHAVVSSCSADPVGAWGQLILA